MAVRDHDALVAYFAGPPEGHASLESIDLARIPRHIAVIMDGNGRWAEKRGLERGYGHAAGVKALREVITACVRLGVEVLTVYAFSTENWKRPQEEVDLLMSLFASTLIDELPLMDRENVRLKYLGDMTSLPFETRDTFLHGLAQTAGHTGLTLAVAVNYGSRDEIARAAANLARRVERGEISVGQITPDLLADELDTSCLPDPDLLIRTSGEKRISNFLLWQLSYTEFSFSDILWPDYSKWDLLDAIADFQIRHRRYGAVDDE